MLSSGWILPNGTEIDTTQHEETVRSFIRGLSKNPLAEMELGMLLKRFFNESVYPDSMLCDFATGVLGWVKVGSSHEKNITYAGFYFQESIVEPYLACGFDNDFRCFDKGSCYFLHSSSREFLMDCEWMKIINDGTNG